MDKQYLLKQFSTYEERLDFSKVLDSLNFCQKYKKNVYTHFLNPIKTRQFMDVLSKEKINNVYNISFGGHALAERSVIGFFYGENSSYDEFPVVAILVKYNNKYTKSLSHRDFLGSVLGLGIDRAKIGDILVSDGEAIIYVLDEIVDYICLNLEKVSNVKVVASKIELNDICEKPISREEKKIVVASLRLDVILSSVFNMSRSKISKLILSDKVMINWSVVNNVSKMVYAGDILTLRGSGRVEILEIIGKSKKDKIIVNISKF